MIKLDRTQQLTDIIHETILYSGLEAAIISTPIFNRLHRILQSSLVYLTYSSNKVKRFEHSIGTMYLAGEMFVNSISNSVSVSALLEEAKKEIIKWNNEEDFTHYQKSIKRHYLDKFSKHKILEVPVPNCNLYYANFPHNVDKKDSFVFFILFQAIRIAGLLHDVGHLPYSHVFEHAAQQLYVMVKNEPSKNLAQSEFLRIMKEYCDTEEACEHKQLHEEIGINLIKQIRIEVLDNLVPQEENLFVLAVLKFAEKILCSDEIQETIYSDLHKIISGVIDADRLDYCTRDLFCCGVRQNKFPFKRFLSNYRLVLKETEDKKQFLFCPAIKNISEVEDLLDRRWRIFSNINYHHRVHKHEVIFAEILAKVGYDELKGFSESLPELQSGKELPLKLSSIWLLVKELQSNNALIDYLVIQLDDGWMDTLLKHAFFEKYGVEYRNEEKNAIDADWNKFDELISTKKHYLSIYKRYVDFRAFDRSFGEKLVQYVNNKGIQNQSTTLRKLCNMINANLAPSDTPSLRKSNYNLFTSILLPSNSNTFYQEVEEKINEFLSQPSASNLGIVNCIIKPCDLSMGFVKTNNHVMLWASNNTCENFTAVSLKGELLTTERDARTPFHLYYLPKPNQEEHAIDILESKLIEIIIDISEKYFAKVLYTEEKI